MGGEPRFSGNHLVRALGVVRGSSTRGQERQGLLRRHMMFEWAPGLDVTGGGFKTDGAKVAIDVEVVEFPALEAGFIVTGRVTGKGHVVVTVCLSDFSMGDSSLFFLSQRRQGDRGGGVFRSSGGFFNESLGRG